MKNYINKKKMRHSISIIILSFSVLCSKGQDLIVTDKGDSVNCKITKVGADNISFIFKYEKKMTDTLLSNSEFTCFRKNYFALAEVQQDKIYKNNYPKIRVHFNGGWSHMTAKVSDKVPQKFRQYVEQLKTGYHFGGDLDFFPFKNIGFGVKYSRFRTTNELNNVNFTDSTTGQIYKGKLRDDITVQYFGPSICLRLPVLNNKVCFNSDFSIGYLLYKNKAIMLDNYNLSGKTVGLVWNLGAEYYFEKNFSISLTGDYIIGRLDQYEYVDRWGTQTMNLKKEDYEGISRIDISIGLKWHL